MDSEHMHVAIHHSHCANLPCSQGKTFMWPAGAVLLTSFDGQQPATDYMAAMRNAED
jgi:hypothetical protein